MTAGSWLARLGALALAVGCAEPDASCPSPIVSVRDPALLVCVPRKAPAAECPLIGPLPPWSRCGDPCERIRDAPTCAATAGCRIGWLDCLTFPDQCDQPDGFIACYGVTTVAPPVGACADLIDPEGCAARDDCAGVYIKGTQCPGGDPFPRAPNGEACRFTYANCTDELSPPM